MCQQALEKKYPLGYLDKNTFSSTETGAICTTSGTTGLPKIIEVSSAAAICIGKTIQEGIKLNSGDIVLGLVPIHSGPGATACLAAPIAGAKIILTDKFDPEEALRLVEKERVTVVTCVPIQLIMMARHPNFDKYDLSSLRLVAWSGAPLPYYMALELEQRLGCTLVGGYGAWDAGGFSFGSIDDPPEIRHLTVGNPMKGNEIKVVNDKGEEVPRGEVGNILVRGASCFPGYYKDPEAVLQTWTAMGKEGWFKPGDLGKFDEHGNLLIMGRKGEVIHRSGKEIFPLEIENLLVAHPKVADAAVVPMPDPVTGEKACACVVPRPGQKLAFDEMISYLTEKGLPSDRLPERLEVLEKLPTSEGGSKVLKKELVKDITQKLEEGNT
jgi:acyl-coenzyme A synthetase/AMP-(fatty) acid ligase